MFVSMVSTYYRYINTNRFFAGRELPQGREMGLLLCVINNFKILLSTCTIFYLYRIIFNIPGLQWHCFGLEAVQT